MAGDVKQAVVSGALNTGAAATTDFTKSGFGTVKAAIITLTFADGDDGSSDTEYKICIGLTDFMNSRFISAQTEDGSAKEDADRRKGKEDAYYLLTVTGGDGGHGNASAIIDGVRLTNESAFSRAVFVEITLFGGADLAVECGSHNLLNRTVGNTNVQTTNIDQDIIFFIGLDRPGEDTVGASLKNSFGVASTGREASQSLLNRCVGFATDNNATEGAPFAHMRNDRCLSIVNDAGVLDWGIELTAANATTFTTTIRDVDPGAGMEVYYLALALDPSGSRRKSEIGSIDSPTASGDWSKTGLGFKPGYVGLSLNRLTVENLISTSSEAGSIAFSHNTGLGEETCHAFYDEFNVATINANCSFRSRAIYQFTHNGTSIGHDLSHSTFDSGGWTYSQIGTPSTFARKWFYWAFEEASAAGPNIVVPLGTFTLAGQIPSIQTGVTVPVPLKIFTLTGFEPTISAGGIVINVPIGSFTLASFIPTINIGVNVVPPLGTFTLTGQVPSIETGVIIITPLGTFTLTGFIPSINIGVNIITPLGSFTKIGFIPIIVTGVNVITPLGAFTLTGFIPIIAAGAISIIVPSGSFTVNFIVPTVASGGGAVVPLGIFNLIGFIPNVGTGVIITPPLGSFTKTGFIPSIDFIILVPVPLKQFSLTTFIPIIHSVNKATKTLNEIDLTPPFEDISQIRYLFRNFALLRDVLEIGVTGQFTTTDGKTIHIRNGVVIDIF